MSKLVWSETNKRVYEAGLDRGVLYLANGRGVSWDGLIAMDEAPQNADIVPYYIDGVRYYNQRIVGDSTGVLKAYTYPDEFLQFDGYSSPTVGLFANNQPVESTFGLSYRTLIGNPTDGLSFGYKIHILYNLVAIPSTKSYTSLSSSVNPLEFTWTIEGLPVDVPGFKPTNHFVVDTRYLPKKIIEEVEAVLYGTDTTQPTLPSITDLIGLIFNVVDNGDGTWTAKGSDEVIEYLDPDKFQITWPGAVYITPDTYKLSNVPEES